MSWNRIFLLSGSDLGNQYHYRLFEAQDTCPRVQQQFPLLRRGIQIENREACNGVSLK